MTTIARPELEGLKRYKFGWADSDGAGGSARRGLSEEVVRDISGATYSKTGSQPRDPPFGSAAVPWAAVS